MTKRTSVTAFTFIVIFYLLAITAFSQQSWIWSRNMTTHVKSI